MKAYPDYKESGVSQIGVIPSHWTTAGLKNIFRVVGGSTPQSGEASYWDGDIVWVTPADLSKLAGRGVSGSQRMITGAGLNACGSSLVPEGSLILSTRAPIGSLAVAEREMCTNQGCKALVPAKAVEPTFYYFVLSVSTEALNVRGRGTTFLELSGDALGSFPVPLPPLPEQQAIAAFLDRETAKLDALVEEQRRLIALLKEKRQAVISHAVTRGLDPTAPLKPSGIDWLGDIPAHWGIARIKDVKAKTKNALVDGPFGSNLKSEHFVENGQVYVIESGFATSGALSIDHLKTITVEHFDTIDRSEAKAGDIVIAKIGAYFGRSAVLPELPKKSVVSGNSMKLSVDTDTCCIDFVLTWLQFIKSVGVIDEQVNTTAQPALSLGIVNNLPILVPPLSEQRLLDANTSEARAQFDALTAEATRAIALLQERRAALISAAVTGKIDVRESIESKTPEEAA